MISFSVRRARKSKAHQKVCFAFCRTVQEGLKPTGSEGMNTSGLMTRSFKCSRRRWRMKGVLEKAKTRSIGVRQYPRRLCFACASKGIALRELVQGLGCRLGRCFRALHRGVHRTPAPFSRNQRVVTGLKPSFSVDFSVNEGYFVSNMVVVLVGSKVAIVK